MRMKINQKLNKKSENSDPVEQRIKNLKLEKKYFKLSGPIECQKKLRDALRRLRATGISTKLFKTVLRKIERRDLSLIKLLDKNIANAKDVKTSYINWSKVINYVKEIEEVMEVEDWI